MGAEPIESNATERSRKMGGCHLPRPGDMLTGCQGLQRCCLWLSTFTGLAPSDNPAPPPRSCCTCPALQLAPQKTQLAFAHREQPQDRWWERSHILKNCQRSQLRFSKPFQSEPSASSLTRQPTPAPGFSHPLDHVALLPNCAHHHSTYPAWALLPI